jgi:cytochrome c oxidase subunit 2
VQIDRFERIFMAISAVFIVIALGALTASVTVGHVHLPQPAGRIDPAKVRQTPPFDKPGLSKKANGDYQLVLVAQAWQWTPQKVTVPVGSTVQIEATSIDVTHGIRIPGTNANVMVVPGQISQISVPFKHSGQYTLLCHEFCGIGHQGMYMTINVR